MGEVGAVTGRASGDEYLGFKTLFGSGWSSPFNRILASLKLDNNVYLRT